MEEVMTQVEDLSRSTVVPLESRFLAGRGDRIDSGMLAVMVCSWVFDGRPGTGQRTSASGLLPQRGAPLLAFLWSAGYESILSLSRYFSCAKIEVVQVFSPLPVEPEQHGRNRRPLEQYLRCGQLGSRGLRYLRY